MQSSLGVEGPLLQAAVRKAPAPTLSAHRTADAGCRTSIEMLQRIADFLFLPVKSFHKR
ncbi:MAG: hypothetical protein JO303_13045 [Caulobacteraceae bacterium]|nr:hypothetical protein [Caulobacteraceae bacterium]